MKEIVMSQEEILLTTQKMGEEITKVLEKEDNIPICLVVMRGAMNFASDLLKSIKTNVFVDYIHVSSYEGTSTNGVIHLHFDVQSNVKGKTVLIIDIQLNYRNPALYVVVMNDIRTNQLIPFIKPVQKIIDHLLANVSTGTEYYYFFGFSHLFSFSALEDLTQFTILPLLLNL